METIGHGFSFSYNAAVQTALSIANSENPHKTTRAIEQHVEIWGGFLWLIPGYGYLSSSAFLRWVQRNHS